jgi:sugar phosphate isomerase/epimerase
MKLSCLPVSFFDQIINGSMSIREWAAFGAEIGLDAIDLSVLFFESLDSAYLENMRGEIVSAGMNVAMVTAYPDFTHPDQDQRKKEIDRLISYIRAVGEIGGKMLRCTSGQAHPGLKDEDGIRWALEGLRACEDAAREAGVQLVLENHGKPGCWEYTDFDQPTPIFLALAERIKDTSVKINFDTANPLVANDDSVDVLKKVSDQVFSIHAADTSTRGELNHVLLGTGLVPFDKLFGYLKNIGFDGWICMEENSKMGEEGVKKAAEYIRKTWVKA